MGKIYNYVRTGIFVILGVLVFIFNKALVQEEAVNINFLVGGLMLLFAVDGVLGMIFNNTFKIKSMRFMSSLINLLLGIILIFLVEAKTYEVVITSVCWCIWSIMRESEEIFEKVLEEFKKVKVTSIINLVESIIVIFFSIELLLDPTSEEHIHAHVILLGFELILEVAWIYFAKLELYIIGKLKNNSND